MVKIAKGVINNLLFNSGSTFLYAIALQILVFPVISQHVGAEMFGRLLTVVAIVNIVGMVLGGALSNLVLKEYGENEKSIEKNGGFVQYNNCFFISVLMLIPMLLLLFYYLQSENIVIPLLTTIALALRVYLVVEFRLDLNYFRVAITRVFIVVGYGIGLLAFINNYFSDPIIIIFIGEIFCLTYFFWSSSILRAGIDITNGLINKMRRFIGLSLSVISNNLAAYGDRLILAQVVGFAAVPVFFSAAIGGRLVQMCLDTVSNVLLSYLVNYNSQVTVKRLLGVSVACVIFSLFVWLILQVVVSHIIAYLYPDYLDKALLILNIVNAGFAVKSSELLLRPLVIKLVPVRSIALVDSILVVVYLLSGTVSAYEFGLYGFALSFFIVGLLRVLFLMILIYKNSHSVNEKTHTAQ